MQDENNRLVELVIQLRKQLAEAETRRGLYQQDVPNRGLDGVCRDFAPLGTG